MVLCIYFQMTNFSTFTYFQLFNEKYKKNSAILVAEEDCADVFLHSLMSHVKQRCVFTITNITFINKNYSQYCSHLIIFFPLSLNHIFAFNIKNKNNTKKHGIIMNFAQAVVPKMFNFLLILSLKNTKTP